MYIIKIHLICLIHADVHVYITAWILENQPKCHIQWIPFYSPSYILATLKHCLFQCYWRPELTGLLFLTAFCWACKVMADANGTNRWYQLDCMDLGLLPSLARRLLGSLELFWLLLLVDMYSGNVFLPSSPPPILPPPSISLTPLLHWPKISAHLIPEVVKSSQFLL